MSDLCENDDSDLVGELELNFAVHKVKEVKDFDYCSLAESDDLNMDLNQHGKLGLPSGLHCL